MLLYGGIWNTAGILSGNRVSRKLACQINYPKIAQKQDNQICYVKCVQQNALTLMLEIVEDIDFTDL